jgi:hypothetical protein
MHKKCVTCDILLDVPCANPSCAGHHNESLAEMCVYCATHERETRPFLQTWPRPNLLVSSLADSESNETAYEERALLES